MTFLVVETDGHVFVKVGHILFDDCLLLSIEGVGRYDDDLAGVDATGWLK